MPSPRVTRDALLKSKPQAELLKEIEIPGRGTMVIRSFTKAVQRNIRLRTETAEEGAASDQLFELCLILYGVAEPELDEETILQMFEVWENEEVDYLLSEIVDFNGMRSDFIREEVARFRKG